MLKGKPARAWLPMAALLLGLIIINTGCALFTKPYKPAMLQTKTLVFYPDRLFNKNYILLVDVAFFTVNQDPKEITAEGGDGWFEKKKRGQWPYKQSISLQPGRRQKVELKLQPPADCQGFVVLANMINISDDERRILVFSASQKEKEFVFVTNKGLYR
jgi:hypothetical protein